MNVECSDCIYYNVDIKDYPCNGCDPWSNRRPNFVAKEPQATLQSIDDKLSKIMEHLGIKG